MDGFHWSGSWWHYHPIGLDDVQSQEGMCVLGRLKWTHINAKSESHPQRCQKHVPLSSTQVPLSLEENATTISG